MSRDVSSVWHEFIVIEESVCETVSVRIAETAALAYLTWSFEPDSNVLYTSIVLGSPRNTLTSRLTESGPRTPNKGHQDGTAGKK